MTTTFEKVWQFDINRKMDSSSTTNANKNAIWWFKAFLCGQLATQTVGGITQGSLLQGLWTIYQSNDGGGNFGSAGDGYDRWSTIGSTTGSSGSAASLTTGATIVGAIRLTGVSGMSSADVGKFMTITGAATTANNSPTNTPFKIVQFNSATSVDIYNIAGVTGDANNGAISWVERNAPSVNNTNLVSANAGTNHSWIVLKSPIAMGPYYLTIDYSNSTNTQQITLGYSKTAPTGGTATARPTATDEVFMANWVALTLTQNLTTALLHGGLATDGTFWIAFSRGTGTIGFAECGVIFQSPADTKTADTYKTIMYAKGAQNNNAFTMTNLQTSGNWGSRNFNGTTSSTGLLALDANYNQSAFVMDNLAVLDATDGQYDDLPVYLFHSTAGQFTLKGRLYDHRRAPTNLPDGFCEPNPSTATSTILGNLWFPCNTAILL